MPQPYLAAYFLLGLLGGALPSTLDLPSAVQDESERRLFRGVAVSRDYAVLSYAGDLWRVPVSGGEATRLTRGPEEDAFPALSPDGLQVAFSRRGADDWDVYRVSLEGGEPERVTYHPEADIVRGWTQDGTQILFVSHRDEEFIFRLHTIAPGAALPRALQLPRGWDASYSPDGTRIAYVPRAQPLELFDTDWRHYRGGMTAPIWIAELRSGEISRIPRQNSNDLHPMWVGETVYFVSDRSGTFNLHAYRTNTGTVEQLTDYQQYGIDWASAGGGSIAFLQDGRLRIFELTTREIRTPPVELRPDRSALQPRTVSGARWVASAAPSAAGDRLSLGYRGDVVLLDLITGDSQNLTRSSGTAERYPAISPDGRWVAYFSDASGEYELRVRPLQDSGAVRRIPVEMRPSFYREITWSPDSRHLAFSDKRLNLWVADIETGGARRVTTSNYSFQDLYQPSWSPDGSWLAFSRYEPNRLRAVYLYQVDRGRTVRITGARVNAEHPVFDRGGRYLYFIASNTAALGEFGWSVLSGTLFRPLVSRRLQAVVLREGLPAPVFPVIGQPVPAADSLVARPRPREGGGPPGGQRPPRGRPEAARRDTPLQGPATVIDLPDIEERIVPLPLPARDYAGLAAGDSPGSLYVLISEWPDGLTAVPSRSLHRYELSRPGELTRLTDDVDEFAVTADGRKVLYRNGRDWALMSGDTAAGGRTPVDFGRVQIEIDPAAEWRQIYHEAWRLMRDYFYDPNFHGHDLDALEAHYATYLPAITRRRDLNALLGKALGHISVSHLSIDGGDIPPPDESGDRIGLLGADYRIDRGRARITRVYRSGHYNAASPLYRAPLDQPAIYVREGDYLLAVNGEPIRTDRNLYSYFEGTSLAPTTITVAPESSGEGARDFTVVPLPGENSLRRMNWAEVKRQAVETESQGILGYVWVPNFGARGLETVFQQLLESVDKRGLIIDQRFAGGGVTSDQLIEWLQRTPIYYYLFRHGEDLGVPTNPLPQAKVLLINDANPSAAETFALMFKLGGLGRLIGTRTLGAGIGPYVYIPRLIDGGRISIPNRAAFDPAGEWAIENQGVEPHIEVELLPVDWRQGRDPQLQAAINTVLQVIVDSPPLEVTRPEYPVHK